MIVRTCPKCKSMDIHRSHRRGLESLLVLVLMRPLRCHACNHRFLGMLFGTSLAPPAKKRRREHADDEQLPGAVETTHPE